MDIIKNEDAYADNIHPIEDILSVQFIKCELIDSKVEYLLNMSDPKEVFQKQFSVLNLQIAEAILKALTFYGGHRIIRIGVNRLDGPINMYSNWELDCKKLFEKLGITVHQRQLTHTRAPYNSASDVKKSIYNTLRELKKFEKSIRRFRAGDALELANIAIDITLLLNGRLTHLIENVEDDAAAHNDTSYIPPRIPIDKIPNLLKSALLNNFQDYVNDLIEP